MVSATRASTTEVIAPDAPGAICGVQNGSGRMIAPDVLDLPPGEVAPLIRTELSDRTSLRIGLISDTHIPEARAELWPQVFDVFAGVDAILHGGDIHELFVLDQLAELAPLWSARGNGEDGSAGRSDRSRRTRACATRGGSTSPACTSA